jgi:isopentenyl-diphosphate Delta-isomerase
MGSEHVVVVDECGQDVLENDVVKTIEKMEAHRKGVRHRAVSVFLFNRRGALLAQRRAMKKDHSRGLWSNTCCTHCHAGEKPLDTATRRLQEELGVEADLKEIFKLSYWASVAPGLIENEWDHVFFGVSDCAPRADPEEVSDWAWWDVRYMRERIAASPESFTCWLRYSFEQVHDYAKTEGVFSLVPQESDSGIPSTTNSKTRLVICPYESASGDVDYGDQFIKGIVSPVLEDRRHRYRIIYG